MEENLLRLQVYKRNLCEYYIAATNLSLEKKIKIENEIHHLGARICFLERQIRNVFCASGEEK